MSITGYRMLDGTTVCPDCAGPTKTRGLVKLYTGTDAYQYPAHMIATERPRKCALCGKSLISPAPFTLQKAAQFGQRINNRRSMVVINLEFTQNNQYMEYCILVEVARPDGECKHYRLYNEGDFEEMMILESLAS